jgi:hypothetical protein
MAEPRASGVIPMNTSSHSQGGTDARQDPVSADLPGGGAVAGASPGPPHLPQRSRLAAGPRCSTPWAGGCCRSWRPGGSSTAAPHWPWPWAWSDEPAPGVAGDGGAGHASGSAGAGQRGRWALARSTSRSQPGRAVMWGRVRRGRPCALPRRKVAAGPTRLRFHRPPGGGASAMTAMVANLPCVTVRDGLEPPGCDEGERW